MTGTQYQVNGKLVADCGITAPNHYPVLQKGVQTTSAKMAGIEIFYVCHFCCIRSVLDILNKESISWEKCWVTFLWHWPKIMAVALVNKEILICMIKWEPLIKSLQSLIYTLGHVNHLNECWRNSLAKIFEAFKKNSDVVFYPRPVLAFGYCLCLRLCVCLSVCLCVCVNHLLVRTITRDPFKLGSPNLDQRCKRPWLRSLLFCGLINLDLQGQI